jgi:hypothetical protein
MTPASTPSEMTSEEFKAIRLRLKPRHFVEYMPERKDGPGRPPSGEVTQAALGARLGKSAEQIGRYERGVTPIPLLVAEALRRLDPKR